MEKANLNDQPSSDQQGSDRRKAQDSGYSGDERRKGERRKHQR